MSLLEKTKLLLRANQISPKRFLGQNFMVEPSIFPVLSDCAALGDSDVTLDIGAGLGFLTGFLAKKCRKVLAVEIDRKLVSVLHEQLEGLANVDLIEGNILRVPVPEFNKVVSIPPYQISSRLLLWLFNRHFDCAAVILQREFTNKLVAPVGCEDYGWLTILAYQYAECELQDEISKTLFYPQPRVDSVIVRLTPKQSVPFALKSKALFTKLTQSLFTQRNRKVKNAILPFVKREFAGAQKDAGGIAKAIPFHDKRVRELSPEDFGELANALTW